MARSSQGSTSRTILCNGEGYMPGVEALGGSIKASGTREPMVLMVTPEVRPVTRERLAAQGWTVREVEPIANPNPTTQQMLPRFGAACAKLRAWQLVDVDKVVFLDTDTIVLKNVDDLFLALPALLVVRDRRAAARVERGRHVPGAAECEPVR
jgi:alpha-N-acetylglucosamine transferase